MHLLYKESPEGKKEDIRQAKLVDDAVRRILFTNAEKRYPLLVDVSVVNSWRYIPSESRAIYGGIVGDRQIKRVAVYGSNVLLGVAATLIAQVSGKAGALKFFDNKNSALLWLKKDEE